jgi:hypothetical protein
VGGVGSTSDAVVFFTGRPEAVGVVDATEMLELISSVLSEGEVLGSLQNKKPLHTSYHFLH